MSASSRSYITGVKSVSSPGWSQVLHNTWSCIDSSRILPKLVTYRSKTLFYWSLTVLVTYPTSHVSNWSRTVLVTYCTVFFLNFFIIITIINRYILNEKMKLDLIKHYKRRFYLIFHNIESLIR